MRRHTRTPRNKHAGDEAHIFPNSFKLSTGGGGEAPRSQQRQDEKLANMDANNRGFKIYIKKIITRLLRGRKCSQHD